MVKARQRVEGAGSAGGAGCAGAGAAPQRLTAVAVLARPVGVPPSNGSAAPGTAAERACGTPNPEDWDLLFRAALVFLNTWALERPQPPTDGRSWQRPGMALGECLLALDQLRRTVPQGQVLAPPPLAQGTEPVWPQGPGAGQQRD